MKTEKTIVEKLGLKNIKLGDQFDFDGVVADLTNTKNIEELEMREWQEGARVFIEESGETCLIAGNKLGDLFQAIDRALEGEVNPNVLSGVCSAIGTPYEARAENFDLLALFD